jgi:hypothetical protein
MTGSPDALLCDFANRSELLTAFASLLQVDVPEPRLGPVHIGPDAPAAAAQARIWLRTAYPPFMALHSDGGWVAAVGQGTLRPWAEGLPSMVVKLTAAEVTALGLAGEWGRITYPVLTDVTYI